MELGYVHAVWDVTGYETKMAGMLQKMVPQEYYGDCFIPKIEIKKKYLGNWHIQHVDMVPGYIFKITDDINKVYFALKNFSRFAKILGDWQEPISLYGTEAQLLQSMKR